MIPRLRVHNFAISVDGYGAGPSQDRDNPLGVGGAALHEWAIGTRTFRRMMGTDGGTGGLNDEYMARGIDDVGAWIIGRNMFGPIRGPWPDDAWKGWWGEEPPYHAPVFVLTHHRRDPLVMRGGTTFHFVKDGVETAVQRAFDAANGADVRLGGGVATIRQFLQARLIDEMHLAVIPVLLGAGEHLLYGMNLPDLGYRCARHEHARDVSHYRIERVEK